MPELTEEMYCHQQICIPPTFPYLLRQYAKAAIRSQPTDLLKWSTAYFRCLSLNIPPPVKPRLEYPIPRDYAGITPGWLKALNYQLLNNQTVPFKILWDRWVGSCLQHDTLIKILCLGGFTDSMAIPWNRFLGLCAAHLTENLTQTMILLCEILTEEPEGGCAMIPLVVFLDVYKFLAAIDASKQQTLINYYFTDAALNLYQKEKKKLVKETSAEEIATVESSTTTAEEVVEEQEYGVVELGEESIVSCPDIVSDDALQEPDLDKDRKDEDDDEIIALKQRDRTISDLDDQDSLMGKDDYRLVKEESSRVLKTSSDLLHEDSRIDVEFESATREDETEPSATRDNAEEGTSRESIEKEDDDDDHKDDEEAAKDFDVETIDDVDKEDDSADESARRSKSVEAQLKSVEQDILEKGGIELEDEPPDVEEVVLDGKDMYSEQLSVKEDIAEMHGEGGFYKEIDELEEHIRVKYKSIEMIDELVQEEILEEEEAPEEVEIDIIPGIGPVVPEELVEAVVAHLTQVASEEHGMTMPRHIRHYTCPPLEIYP